jgi:hypothetical protein
LSIVAVSVQWLSVWSESVVVNTVLSIIVYVVHSIVVTESIVVSETVVVNTVLSIIVSVVHSVVSVLTIVHSVVVVHPVIVSVLSIVVSIVGSRVAIVRISVHGIENARHFFVVGNSTQRVLAKTPSSHISVGISGNCTPRKLHASVGRKDSVSGTSVVGNSIASERESTLVGELG